MQTTTQLPAQHPQRHHRAPRQSVVATVAVTMLCAALLTPHTARADIGDFISRLLPNSQTTWVSTSKGGREIKSRISGSIEWNANEDDVQSLSGKAVFQEKNNGRMQRMVFEAEKGGVTRTYSVDGKVQVLDAAGRRWLAEMIGEFNRESSAGAAQRVKKRYARGGINMVLDDLEAVRSGHTRLRQVEALVSLASLDEKSLERLINAVKAIDGDFEQRGALSAIIDKQILSAALQVATLHVIASMGSAFEQRSVLTALAPKLIDDGAVAQAWIKALGSMDSDFEMRAVIESLSRRNSLTPALISLTLQTTQKIDSDFERAASLRAMIRHLSATDQPQLEAFLASAQQIDSDFERCGVLVALVNRATLGTPGYVAVLKAVDGMDSDFEIKNVLTAVAKNMPANVELVSRYRKLARALSDHERGQAERALDHLNL